jgi:hypothetical protein
VIAGDRRCPSAAGVDAAPHRRRTIKPSCAHGRLVDSPYRAASGRFQIDPDVRRGAAPRTLDGAGDASWRCSEHAQPGCVPAQPGAGAVRCDRRAGLLDRSWEPRSVPRGTAARGGPAVCVGGRARPAPLGVWPRPRRADRRHWCTDLRQTEAALFRSCWHLDRTCARGCAATSSLLRCAPQATLSSSGRRLVGLFKPDRPSRHRRSVAVVAGTLRSLRGCPTASC